MIYWDIDGVLRDLSKIVWGFDPDDWNYKSPERLSIFDIIRMNPMLLVEAPAGKYIDVARKQKELLILSAQLPHWRTLTEMWISTHLKDVPVYITFVDNSQEKLKYLKDGDYLIDDCPLFPDYSKIILVDRKYNRNVNAPIRVKTPKELEEILNELKRTTAKF